MFGALVLDGIFVLAEAEISGFWRWSEWHLLWWPWFLDECWWKDDELPCMNLWLFCLVCWTWRSLSYPHMCILYLLQILIAYYMYIYTVETQIAQRQIIYECTYVWIFLWYYGIYILYILSTMNNVMLTSCPWWNTPRKSAYPRAAQQCAAHGDVATLAKHRFRAFGLGLPGKAKTGRFVQKTQFSWSKPGELILFVVPGYCEDIWSDIPIVIGSSPPKNLDSWV